MNISDSQLVKLSNITRGEFDGDIDMINILILKDRTNLIDTLVVNDISFNFIIDMEGNVHETLPVGKLSTMSERYCEIGQYSGKNEVTIAIVAGHIVNSEATAKAVRNILGRLMYRGVAELKVSKNFNIVNFKGVNDLIARDYDPRLIVDILFAYFKEFI